MPRPPPSMRRWPDGPNPRDELPSGAAFGLRRAGKRASHTPAKPERITTKTTREPVDPEVEARSSNHQGNGCGADRNRQPAVRCTPDDEHHGQHSVEGDGLRGMSGRTRPSFVRSSYLKRGCWTGSTDGRLHDVIESSRPSERGSHHDERLPAAAVKPEVAADSEPEGNDEEGRSEPGDELYQRRQPAGTVAGDEGRDRLIRGREPAVPEHAQ